MAMQMWRVSRLAVALGCVGAFLVACTTLSPPVQPDLTATAGAPFALRVGQSARIAAPALRRPALDQPHQRDLAVGAGLVVDVVGAVGGEGRPGAVVIVAFEHLGHGPE